MADETSTGISNPLVMITALVIFSFAVMVDILDLIMEFIGVATINPGFGHTVKITLSKAISTVIDLGSALIIGGWTYWVQKQGASRRKEEKPSEGAPPKKGEPAIEKEVTRDGTKEVGKVGTKETGKAGTKAARKAGSKVGGRLGLRVGLGTGISLIGELIPFLGSAPFWTLTVITTFISAIKEK